MTFISTSVLELFIYFIWRSQLFIERIVCFIINVLYFQNYLFLSDLSYGITDFPSQSDFTGVLTMFQPPREDKGAGNCKISNTKYLMDLGLPSLSPVWQQQTFYLNYNRRWSETLRLLQTSEEENDPVSCSQEIQKQDWKWGGWGQHLCRSTEVRVSKNHTRNPRKPNYYKNSKQVTTISTVKS